MRSKLDNKGQPLNHGTRWNGTDGIVIKAISRGPIEDSNGNLVAQEVVLNNPRRAQPRRVLSSYGVEDSDINTTGGNLTARSSLAAGETITLVVEY
tara:strand:+ start:5748 stop:6035 length:288 start_codon:yes stop_codon:yes gene_type:complete